MSEQASHFKKKKPESLDLTDGKDYIINNNQDHFNKDQHNTELLPQLQRKNKFPVVSKNILEEGIKKQYLPYTMRDKLITNPNKYSLFFTKFDCESPSYKQALQQLNLQENDIEVLTFDKFCGNQQQNLENLMKYLYYITEMYKTLKKLVKTRQQIKQDSISLKFHRLNSGNSHYPDSVGDQLTLESEDRSIVSRKNNYNVNNTSMLSCRSIERVNMSVEEKASFLQNSYDKQDLIWQKKLESAKQLDEKRKNYYNVNLTQFENKIKNLEEKQQKLIQQKQALNQEKQMRVMEKHKEIEEKLEEKSIMAIDDYKEKVQQYKEFLMRKQSQQELKIKEKQDKEYEQLEKLEMKRSQIQNIFDRKIMKQITEEEEKLENISQKQNDRHQQSIMKSVMTDQKIKSIQQQKHINESKNELENLKEYCTRIKYIDDRRNLVSQQEMKKNQEKVQNYRNKMLQITTNLEHKNIKFSQFIDQTRTKLKDDEQRLNKVQSLYQNKSHSLSVKNNNKFEQVQVNYALEIMKQKDKQNYLMQRQKTQQEKVNISKLNQEQLHKINFDLKVKHNKNRNKIFENFP